MKNGAEVLGAIAAALEQSGIPFMLTGSFAAAYHGVARATMDIDLVIDPTQAQLELLVAALLRAGQYVSPEAAEDARLHESLFNVIDTDSGWKIDMIVRKSREFSVTEFDRREAIDFDGVQLPVASVEDVILSKLEWARLGGSARQIEDVAALVRMRSGDIDLDYVERWIGALRLDALWETAMHLARDSSTPG